MGSAWAFAPFQGTAVASGAWTGSLLSLPVWLLGAVSVLIVTAFGAGVFVASARRQRRGTNTPPLTKAEVFGIRWRWNYDAGDIRDLTSYCPKCDMNVRPKEETRHGFLRLISYRCECGKWQSKSFQCSQVEMINRVQRTIQKQVRT